jgi:hypothetical protein
MKPLRKLIYISNCIVFFSSDVRLQFRLPDGSSVTQNFPPDAHLGTAGEFICSVRISPKAQQKISCDSGFLNDPLFSVDPIF